MEPLSNLPKPLNAPYLAKNLPLVSLTSSSSTSSSCTQLADTSSSHSTETGEDINDIDNALAIPKLPLGTIQDFSNKQEGIIYVGSEMNKIAPKNDEKQCYGHISVPITEPLIAVNCVGSKIYNGGDNNLRKTSVANNGIRSPVIKAKNSSPTGYLDNARKISDLNTTPHKTSIIDYKNEARNLEQTRNNWSDSNVRKTSKQIERKQSISSEESLSDYEELGGNHTPINGDIGGHRHSRYCNDRIFEL